MAADTKSTTEPTWSVVDNETLRRASGTMLVGHAQAWQHTSAANLPQTASWGEIVAGAALTAATGDTQVMQEHLAKTSLRTVLINAAIWAVVITVAFGAVAAIFHHH